MGGGGGLPSLGKRQPVGHLNGGGFIYITECAHLPLARQLVAQFFHQGPDGDDALLVLLVSLSALSDLVGVSAGLGWRILHGRTGWQ